MDDRHRVEDDRGQVVFVSPALLELHHVPPERGDAAGEGHTVLPIAFGILGGPHAEPMADTLFREGRDEVGPGFVVGRIADRHALAE